MTLTGRPEPDEAALPDPGRPGATRIIATVLLGSLLYIVLATAVAAMGLGAIGAIGAVIVATWAACRVTGLRGPLTMLLVGLAVFFGTSVLAIALLGLFGGAVAR